MHAYVCVCARTCDFCACSLNYPPCNFIRTCFFVLTILHFVFCLYLQLTTQTSMSPAGFQPVIPASKWSEGPATTGIGRYPGTHTTYSMHVYIHYRVYGHILYNCDIFSSNLRKFRFHRTFRNPNFVQVWLCIIWLKSDIFHDNSV